MKKYQIIYADPPWEYEFSHTRSREINDYKTLSKEEICNFKVKDIADNNSILLMWITFPKLEWAFDVMKMWGFEYRTNAFTWIKLNKENKEPFWGMGYYTRSNAEICLLGKRGEGIQAKSHSVNSVIMHPIMEHSKKPPIIREKIVELFGDIPRIELFARKEDFLFECKDWQGWDVWGNEVESDIDLMNL